MNRRRRVIFLVMIILLLPLSITFSRYVIESVKNYLMVANNFFFNSDKLVEGGITYGINNWGGGTYIDVQFQLNNHKNNILTSDTDIVYTVEADCDETKVICNLSAESGTIQVAEKTDDLLLRITPIVEFNDNDSISVTVTANSTSPYEKELSATFVVTVGRRGIDYEIRDSLGSPYLMFTVTNSLETYKAREAFGNYAAGDPVLFADYMNLSDADKAKCASIVVTLSFNPNTVILDTTSDILNDATYTTTTYQGINYINQITFGMDKLMSKEIRFYKRNSDVNYSYTSGSVGNPVITFSAVS